MRDGPLICHSRGRRGLLCAGSMLLIGLMGSIWAPDAISSDPERPTAARGQEIALGGGRVDTIAWSRGLIGSLASYPRIEL